MVAFQSTLAHNVVAFQSTLSVKKTHISEFYLPSFYFSYKYGKMFFELDSISKTRARNSTRARYLKLELENSTRARLLPHLKLELDEKSAYQARLDLIL